MKTVAEHIQLAADILRSKGIEDSILSAQALFSKASGMTKEEIIRSSDQMVKANVTNLFQSWIEKRSNDIPVAYITGEKEFYSRIFHVNSNVLIPRPETEHLIEWFGEKIGNRDCKVCDVGTGSGIIAITLKKEFPTLHVTAIDASSTALDIAKQNAKLHDVSIEWVRSDLFENTNQVFDIIVANLPYIPAKDIQGLSKAVRYEPHSALDGGQDGLDIYRKMLAQMDRHLAPHGEVFMEFGIGQFETLTKMLHETSFSHVECRKDLAGIERILHAKRI